MNKEKFLSELREYLSILENQEQEDILAEYAQHIDMKIQKGLSEEEAIRDFGAVEELAAEILEAYHVNPEFRKKGISLRMPRLRAGTGRTFQGLKAGIVGASASEDDNTTGSLNPETDTTNGGESAWRRVGRRMKEAVACAVRGIRNGFRWLGRKCRAFAGWCSRPFTRRKAEAGEALQRSLGERKGTEEMEGHIGNFFRAVGRGMVMAWRWFVGFCIFCLKFMWNAAWLMFGVFCACMAMIVLMGVGAIPVLLAQGYPFVGIFLICLGGLLCLGSLSFGAFSLLIRKKDDNGDDSGNQYGKDEMTEKSDKEAAYEQTA